MNAKDLQQRFPEECYMQLQHLASKACLINNTLPLDLANAFGFLNFTMNRERESCFFEFLLSSYYALSISLLYDFNLTASFKR